MHVCAWPTHCKRRRKCMKQSRFCYFSGAYSNFPGGNTGGGVCSLWLACWSLRWPDRRQRILPIHLSFILYISVIAWPTFAVVSLLRTQDNAKLYQFSYSKKAKFHENIFFVNLSAVGGHLIGRKRQNRQCWPVCDVLKWKSWRMLRDTNLFSFPQRVGGWVVLSTRLAVYGAADK